MAGEPVIIFALDVAFAPATKNLALFQQKIVGQEPSNISIMSDGHNSFIFADCKEGEKALRAALEVQGIDYQEKGLKELSKKFSPTSFRSVMEKYPK